MHRPGALRRRVGGGGHRRAPAPRGGAHRPGGLPRPGCSRRSFPVAFARAEANQVSDGGGNPRFGPIFDEPAPDRAASRRVRSCVVVTDRPRLAASLTAALEARSITCHRVELAQRLRRRRQGAAAPWSKQPARSTPSSWRPPADRSTGDLGADWERVLAEHRGIVEHIHTDAGWARAAADYAAGADRPVRLVTLTDATTAGGRSRAQASAQHARVAAGATEGRVDGLRREHRGVGGGSRPGRPPHSSPTSSAIPRPPRWPVPSWWSAGGWLGLRSHPRPIGSVTYGGPAVPDWLDATLREIVGWRDAAPHRRPDDRPTHPRRRRPRPPLGPRPHRLVPVPLASSRTGPRRRVEDVPPLRCRHLSGRIGPVERREVRQRRRRHRS